MSGVQDGDEPDAQTTPCETQYASPGPDQQPRGQGQSSQLGSLVMGQPREIYSRTTTTTKRARRKYKDQRRPPPPPLETREAHWLFRFGHQSSCQGRRTTFLSSRRGRRILKSRADVQSTRKKARRKLRTDLPDSRLMGRMTINMEHMTTDKTGAARVDRIGRARETWRSILSMGGRPRHHSPALLCFKVSFRTVQETANKVHI